MRINIMSFLIMLVSSLLEDNYYDDCWQDMGAHDYDLALNRR